MTDKQLAVLLQHILRQINGIEREAHGALRALDVPDDKILDFDPTWRLRGLADAIEKQVKSLEQP